MANTGLVLEPGFFVLSRARAAEMSATNAGAVRAYQLIGGIIPCAA